MTEKKVNLQLKIGVVILAGIFILMALVILFQGLSIGMDMDNRVKSSSYRYLLGTDEWGRDLLSCLIYGTGVSLFISLVVVALSCLTGGILGLVAGLKPGLLDSLIMRSGDIIMAFPGILLAIALAAFVQAGILNMILILSFSTWVGFARITRSEVLKYCREEFIQAARGYGAPFSWILFHHLWPLIRPLLCIQATQAFAGVILAESSLNFLGLGLDPSIPTLGQLIDMGMAHVFDRPQFILGPGILLFLLIIAFNFIGEGLRQHFSR